jgi:2-C-methyl-D-erythritol 4-phosphate cytidylyltransferase
MAPLGGVPVLVRTLQALMAAPSLAGVVLVVPAAQQSDYETYLAPHTFSKPLVWTTGGPTRRDSVYNGLLALPPEAVVVAVHDAARPLIQPMLVEAALIGLVEQHVPGLIVAQPMPDTVKQADAHHHIQATLDRTVLWRAQTPQVFQTAVLKQAHEAIPPETPVTDDAQLLELAGLGPVALLAGPASNLKITTADDLLIADALWAQLHPALAD